MRKMITLLFLLSVSVVSYAPVHKVLYVPLKPQINVFEPLLRAVAYVESRGDDLALNVKEQAFGRLQIRAIRLKDYRMRTGKNYSLVDMFDYEKAREVFLYYAKGKNYETAARNWNGKWELTKDYWQHVRAQLNEHR